MMPRSCSCCCCCCCCCCCYYCCSCGDSYLYLPNAAGTILNVFLPLRLPSLSFVFDMDTREGLRPSPTPAALPRSLPPSFLPFFFYTLFFRLLFIRYLPCFSPSLPPGDIYRPCIQTCYPPSPSHSLSPSVLFVPPLQTPPCPVSTAGSLACRRPRRPPLGEGGREGWREGGRTGSAYQTMVS